MPGFGWLEIHAVDHCNNSCKFCNNSSPYMERREFAASDYLPWLDLLVERGIAFYCISLLGGEPFLHRDITGFTLPFRRFDKSLMLTTNGFWLKEETIAGYGELFEALDILCFSLYPSIAARMGGREEFLRLVEMIRERHPRLRVDVRDVSRFFAFEFLSEPVEVDRFCGNSDCVTLLADGRMGRCSVGTYAAFNPAATPEFLAARDVFYDLRDLDRKDFWMWRKKWPLDACAFCTNFRDTFVDWEYQKRIPKRIL